MEAEVAIVFVSGLYKITCSYANHKSRHEKVIYLDLWYKSECMPIICYPNKIMESHYSITIPNP